MTMYPRISAEQYAADRAKETQMSDNIMAERLRAIADRTSDEGDRTFLHMAANSMDFQDAQNKRLTDKLLSIAGLEDYK